MQKCLYCTAVVFLFLSFFFFSMPNLWGHWTDLNQTWTQKIIHLWLLFEKYGPNSPGNLLATGWGQKTLWDRLWTLTKHISATKHDINNRKTTCQSTGTPLHAPKFGELCWSTNGWERYASFCPPPKFLHWETDTASLTAWTLYNRQQANFGARYVVTRAHSLEQQNAGRTHTGLCHASSYIEKALITAMFNIKNWRHFTVTCCSGEWSQ